MGSYELSERSRRLLTTLVREHIETGEPVASRSLAKRSGLGVSSATVRNILAQLEEAEYVHQPHSSSGRVPTDRGYRVFVNGLLEGRKRSRPSAEVETRLREQADRSPMIDDLLASASHLVSRAARHVGFALCDNTAAILQRIEFVALGGSRVLVVVISRGNQITQKVVDTGLAFCSLLTEQSGNEVQVLEHAEGGVKIATEALRHISHSRVATLEMRRIAQITTKCPHLSRLDLPHPGYQPKQGRLADTIRTDETDHATPGNRERHVVEGDGLAITVRNPLQRGGNCSVRLQVRRLADFSHWGL